MLHLLACLRGLRRHLAWHGRTWQEPPTLPCPQATPLTCPAPASGPPAPQGALLERNVAVGVAGHAFFLEDGAETGNTLRGNLGLLVRPKTEGARLGSDRDGPNGDLSVFWITNPVRS